MKIIETKLKCAVCQNESEQKVVYSRNNFGAITHLDLRCDSGRVSILLQTCPFCNYIAYDISENTSVKLSDIASRECEYVRELEISENAKTCILAGIFAEKNKENEVASHYYLKASWALEDEKKFDLAKVYRTKTLVYLNDIYENNEFYTPEKALQYIDILRKNEEFEKVEALTNEFNQDLAEFSKDPDANQEELKVYQTISDFENKCAKEKDSKDYLLSDVIK